MNIKTQSAIDLAGSGSALAELLGINKSAVSLWGDELPISRAKQLVELRPLWFPEVTAKYTASLKKQIERMEFVHPTALTTPRDSMGAEV
jgi:DNA-binding transcriptional regulator YdaS (Cro superfamily)